MKGAEAKADLHTSKARHAAEKLETKQAGHHYHIPGTGIVTGAGHHVPVTTGHQAFGAAGNIPPGSGTTTAATGHHTHGGVGGNIPGSTTTTTHSYQSNLPPYNKHL